MLNKCVFYFFKKRTGILVYKDVEPKLFGGAFTTGGANNTHSEIPRA